MLLQGVVASASCDRTLLVAAAGLRAVATSLVGTLLGLYLAELGLDASQIGFISSAGLGGAAVAALLVIVGGDRLGRRRWLLGLSLLGAAASVAFLFVRSPWALSALAFLAMLNAMGRDRGAAVVLEQAALPALVSPERRTLAFAWYSALQDAGHALGGLAAALAGGVAAFFAWELVAAERATLAIAPALLLVTVALYAGVSNRIEVETAGTRHRLSPASRRIVARISVLFVLDGLGGGFLVATLLSYYFFERFAATPAAIAGLFFAGRLANVLSHFGAAWLARRIGLVRTMVFTHAPSSLLLVAVAFAETFAVAAVLFVLRECLVEMDVPTRQSYLMAVVEPEARTVASGITYFVRLASWAVAPLIAGVAMDRLALGAPLFIGAGLKLVYDAALYFAFRQVRPPEEEGLAHQR